MPTTHEVVNQVPPLGAFDASEHPLYEETLTRMGASCALAEVREVGLAAGSEEVQRWGDLVEAHPPALQTHDRFGHRIDRVEYDPSYHQLMARAIGYRLAGAPWVETRPHAHAIRAVKYSAWYGSDAGHCCPVTMTYAAVPALRADPGLARRWGLRRHLGDPAGLEYRARIVVGDLAAALQASLLVRFGHPAVAAAFTASRLSERGSACGTLPAGLDLSPILERALPARDREPRSVHSPGLRAGL